MIKIWKHFKSYTYTIIIKDKKLKGAEIYVKWINKKYNGEKYSNNFIIN